MLMGKDLQLFSIWMHNLGTALAACPLGSGENTYTSGKWKWPRCCHVELVLHSWDSRTFRGSLICTTSWDRCCGLCFMKVTLDISSCRFFFCIDIYNTPISHQSVVFSFTLFYRWRLLLAHSSGDWWETMSSSSRPAAADHGLLLLMDRHHVIVHLLWMPLAQFCLIPMSPSSLK